jgi:hypothetical protein
MTQPGRRLVTVALDDAMVRDLTLAATAHNRSIQAEIEMRLMALRLVEESLRILNARENVAQDQTLNGT